VGNLETFLIQQYSLDKILFSLCITVTNRLLFIEIYYNKGFFYVQLEGNSYSIIFRKISKKVVTDNMNFLNFSFYLLAASAGSPGEIKFD